MGTLTGTNLADRARRVLQDTTSGGTRWLDAELLDWINDAQREIVLAKPDANSTISDETLVEGTLQTLPTGGLYLLDVVRNTAGRAVRRVDRGILDNENPDWHSDTGVATVEHYVFDNNAPTSYWVYPPQPSSGFGSVEIIYSVTPTDLASLGDTIDLDDIYANAIIDFTLYRAYSKDADYARNSERAESHLNAFMRSVGGKVQGEMANNPNAGQ